MLFRTFRPACSRQSLWLLRRHDDRCVFRPLTVCRPCLIHVCCFGYPMNTNTEREFLMIRNALCLLLAVVALNACSSETPEQQIVNDAAEAMGGTDRIAAVRT